jgi:hypothetical protein
MSWRIKGSGTGEPSLDLRFAATKSLNDYVSGNNLTTFTRSSTGTYFDANGVLQSAPAGVARFDHNPETGESLGLLMEEARTNLLLNSATFSRSVGGNWRSNRVSNLQLPPPPTSPQAPTPPPTSPPPAPPSPVLLMSAP